MSKPLKEIYLWYYEDQISTRHYPTEQKAVAACTKKFIFPLSFGVPKYKLVESVRNGKLQLGSTLKTFSNLNGLMKHDLNPIIVNKVTEIIKNHYDDTSTLSQKELDEMNIEITIKVEKKL